MRKQRQCPHGPQKWYKCQECLRIYIREWQQKHPGYTAQKMRELNEREPGYSKAAGERHRRRRGILCRAEANAIRRKVSAEKAQTRQREVWLRVVERTRSFILWLKELPCADCGRATESAKLDFHHRPGETKIAEVAWLSQRGLALELLEEIPKCDLICKGCHRRRHMRGE